MRRTGDQYLAWGSTPSGYAACCREYGWLHSPVRQAAVCGALRRGLSSAGHSSYATCSISARIAVIASTNRSSSRRSSDSVGSTMSVPATGNDMVGAWKP
jgi:hypothetical protein